MNFIKKALGEKIKYFRKQRNLSQEKLSEMIGLTPRQLTRIESGQSFPSADTLTKLSIFLNVQIKELFNFFIDANSIMNSEINYSESYIIKEFLKQNKKRNILSKEEIQVRNEMDKIICRIENECANLQKLSFINLAVDALSNNKALKELQIILKGIELKDNYEKNYNIRNI